MLKWKICLTHEYTFMYCNRAVDCLPPRLIENNNQFSKIRYSDKSDCAGCWCVFFWCVCFMSLFVSSQSVFINLKNVMRNNWWNVFGWHKYEKVQITLPYWIYYYYRVSKALRLIPFSPGFCPNFPSFFVISH